MDFAIKRRELLQHPNMVHLKCIVPGEKKSQKASFCMNFVIFWKRWNCRHGKQISGCQCPDGEGGADRKGTQKFAGAGDAFCILTTWVCICQSSQDRTGSTGLCEKWIRERMETLVTDFSQTMTMSFDLMGNFMWLAQKFCHWINWKYFIWEEYHC